MSYFPPVSTLTETSGPTILTVGAIPDEQFFKRSGTTIIGASAGGSSYTVDYDVDFSALANQSFLANGAVTVDGKVWNVENWSAGSVMGIVNGVGLQFVSDPEGGGVSLYTTSHTARLATCPLTSLGLSYAEMGTVKEVWLWARISMPSNGVSPVDGTFVGLESSPIGTRWSRVEAIANGYFRSGTSMYLLGAVQSSGIDAYCGFQSNQGPDASAPITDDVIAVRLFPNGGYAQICSGVWNSGWPARTALTLRAHMRLPATGNMAWREGFNVDGNGLAIILAVSGGAGVSGIWKSLRLEHLPG
jgi:hypothetical protein